MIPEKAQTLMTAMAVLRESPLSSRWEAMAKLIAPPTRKTWPVPSSKSQKARVRIVSRTVQRGSLSAGMDAAGLGVGELGSAAVAD